MEYFKFEELIIERNDPRCWKLIENFLILQGLVPESHPEYTYCLLDGERLAATASLEGQLIKYVAVEPDYQGAGLTNRIVSQLINEAHRRDRYHLFVYTKPENKLIFEDLGFYRIAEIPGQVVLMENQANGIQDFTAALAAYKRELPRVAAMVVNCNPFTLGHQYLVERASQENDLLHIFVVSEDRSDFPASVRLNLVKKGAAHLDNVIVHETQHYLISSATFPSYFIKRKNDAIHIHTQLDLAIFGDYIVPALGIKRRYVGEEPLCPMTSQYNEAMKAILPAYGVEVVVIGRKMKAGEFISASRVRRLLSQDKLAEVKELVPPTTYEYLTSQEGKEIIIKIMQHSLLNNKGGGNIEY